MILILLKKIIKIKNSLISLFIFFWKMQMNLEIIIIYFI